MEHPRPPSMNRHRWILLPIVVLPVTVVLLIPMLLTAVVKLLIPLQAVRRACRRAITAIAEAWLAVLVGMFRRTIDTRFEVTGDLSTESGRSYLVLSNHVSWSDVPVLLYVLHGRVPFFRFFLKRSLIWMPLLGLAFWALEYPFVRFPSRQALERDPSLRGQNLRAARRACEPMRGHAVTVVNFPEGGVFRRERHIEQRSRYRHLLRPRAGGTALVLGAIGDQLDALLDVTLHFPDGPPDLWAFISNRVSRVRVHVRRVDIPGEFIGGDYESDTTFRRRFQDWLNTLWREKDERLDRMRREQAAAAHGPGRAEP